MIRSVGFFLPELNLDITTPSRRVINENRYHNMKISLPTFLLLLTTLLCTTPTSNAAVHAVENFGLDQIEQRSDAKQSSKELREGFRLSKEGKDEQAFKMFSAAAQNDELNAHLVLGVLHREGRGTPKNIPKTQPNLLQHEPSWRNSPRMAWRWHCSS